MIGQTIDHYKILANLPSSTGQVGEDGVSQNHLRSRQRRESGCDFQPARQIEFAKAGGDPPSFWRRRGS